MKNTKLNVIDEIGVQYTDSCNVDSCYEYLTSFYIDSENRIILIKNLNSIEKCEMVNNKIRTVKRYSLDVENIVSLTENKGYYYLLCEDAPIVYKMNREFKLDHSINITCEGIPTNIVHINKYFLVSDNEGWIYIYDSDVNLVKTLDMRIRGFKTITRIIPNSLENFYVIDSLLNIIKLVNFNGEPDLTFGTSGDNDVLYMPTFILQTGETKYLINERRNHCIWEYDIQKKMRRLSYGVRSEAGSVKFKLWEPNWIMKYEGECYVILSKQDCIVRLQNSSYEIVYGGEMYLKDTVFNYQRSCEWCETRKKYLIADTSHNRIVFISGNKQLTNSIEEYDGLKLNNPRMAKWMDGGYYIADTRNCRVIICKEDKIKMLDTVPISGSDWIIGVDLNIYNQQLLLIYENYILVYDMNAQDVCWDSRENGFQYKDLHQAEWIDSDKFIVANTGYNRVEYVDYKLGVVYKISWLLESNKRHTLVAPRMIHYMDGYYYVVNSGKSEILCFRNFFSLELLSIISGGNSLGLYREGLCAPRWISEGPDGNLLISDTDNQRIVICNNRLKKSN